MIGATRHTGKHVVHLALEAGHAVTALARVPARIDVRHERLRVVRGDVLDPATLAPAIMGCDAVVSSREAEHAARLLARKYPFLQGFFVPLTHRLMHFQTLHYELTPVDS